MEPPRTTIKKELRAVVEANKDTVDGMVCFYRPVNTYGEEIRCTFYELPGYEYYPGYGIQQGPTIRCYTADYIYVTHEYDGAEWIDSYPRNP